MRTATSILFGLTLSFLAGCNNNNNNNGQDESATPSGEALVTSLIQDNTTDSAEPVDVNDLDLDFSEDGGAFSSLLDG